MATKDVDEHVYDSANEAIVLRVEISDAKHRKALTHTLAADEFLVPRNAVIQRALRALSDKGLAYDSEIMSRLVVEAGGDSACVEYLRELEIGAGVPANVEWYVETMRWDATRARVLQDTLPALLKAIRDPKAEQSDVVSVSRRVVRALETTGRGHVHRADELRRQYRADIAARRVKHASYPLGVPIFDAHLTEGFAPGKTWITVGLPGAGKSTVWMAFAILLARAGRRVLVCAWEMEPKTLIDVGVSHMTGIDLKSIVQGTFTDEEAERIDRAQSWITSRIRFMRNPFNKRSEGAKPSNERNLDLLEGYLAEVGCDVAVYDVWERMLPWRKPDDVANGLYRMMELHKEYGLCGVIVQHLNVKDVERRPDKRPTRDAIKGVSAYVDVADLILGIHREAQFKSVDDVGIETICLKQRMGESNWACRWKWNGPTCAVKDPEDVAFDPGLDGVVEAGDIGKVRSVAQIKTGGTKNKKERAGRREQ